MRAEHPLIVALVEAFARQAGIDPPMLWRALDGLPSDPKLVEGLVSAFHPMVRLEDFVLTSQHGDNTLTAVDASTSVLRSRGVRRAKGAPETAASKATERAGLTYAEIAARLTKRLKRPFHVNSVQAWHKKKSDPAYRRIPDDAATVLQEMGIPRSVWPGIIPPK